MALTNLPSLVDTQEGHLARHFIDTGGHDPLAQLLAAALEHDGSVQVIDGDAELTAHDVMWFTSQSAFLFRAGHIYDTHGKVHVVLRRSSDDSGSNATETECAVLAELARGFDETNFRFFALTQDALDSFLARGLSNISLLQDILPEHAHVTRTRQQADIDPSRSRFVLHQSAGDRIIGLDAVNWARLARDYVFAARPDAAVDWHDLASFATQVGSIPDGRRDPVYVFVTPNGVGIGHLTRQLAIARSLQEQAPPGRRPHMIFWCYSRAALIAKQAGHTVLLRHTAEHLRASTQDWQDWETRAFTRFLQTHKPDAIITDGSRVGQTIVRAMAHPGCHHPRLIWIQRGMWQAETDIRGLADIRFCDRVLIPGDIAAAEDAGATSRPNPNPPGLSTTITTPPVILVRTEEQLVRRKARKALGLGMRRCCLVSLGGDAFARTSTLYDAILETARQARVRLLWAQSPLASPPQAGQTDQVIALYPISRYLAAFDGVISAAGYNSFHEIMLGCTAPVLFVPTVNARLDDQPARARYATKQGWAQMLDSTQPEEERRTLTAFFQQVRGPRSGTGTGLRLRDGAQDMANHIAALFKEMPEDG